MSGFSPALPFRRDAMNGFQLTQTMLEVVSQNLKNLILTNPGERMMIPGFGVGIKTFLFEMNNDATHGNISSAISSQVKRYMPFIAIENIFFNVDEENSPDSLKIGLVYTIQPLDLIDSLELTVSIGT
tara:strand:+ start:92 stop:475 length:384 start_codon:yes stop_codon:yes gene_type:complete